jgi:catechol 2,3-dioxygenase-like lactoylglutathione lyase family enzyme
MAKAVLGPFAAATVMARDPAAAAAAYVDYLGYEQVISTNVPDDIAGSWGAPAMAGRRVVSVKSGSGNGAVLRFVEGEAMGSYQPFTTYGWNALEILTSDVNSLPAKLDGSPFRIIGMPRDLYPSGAIRAMQTRAAADEMVYLTQINEAPETSYLPKAQTLVDHLFITILGSDDFDGSRRFYEEHFEVTLGEVHEMRVTGLNVAFGLDIETKHRLSTIRMAGKSTLELDHFPEGARHREVKPGEIPPGIAILSLEVDSLDKVDLPFRGPIIQKEGPLYRGRRAATIVGSAGEWIELVERA